MTVPQRGNRTQPTSADNRGQRLPSHPTLLLAKGERHKIRVFLRAPNHKYRINNLKAAREGTGQALEAGALRGTKAGQGEGVASSSWELRLPQQGRAGGQDGGGEQGATPGG